MLNIVRFSLLDYEFYIIITFQTTVTKYLIQSINEGISNLPHYLLIYPITFKKGCP